ncbi:hypothetical protein ACIP5Y_23385 [Nocardia sp. NPDC088792]|uniref:hypothetical protein n=1 Tax=Nocardia sp. NPDC088792 TaxID=3364332 RepID=UPI003801F4D5
MNIAPAWRASFVRDAVDSAGGAGTYGRLLSITSPPIALTIFGYSLALQNPALHDATAAAIATQWSAQNAVLEGLAAAHAF